MENKLTLAKGKYKYEETPNGWTLNGLSGVVSPSELEAVLEILELQRRLDNPFSQVWTFLEDNSNIDICKRALDLKNSNPGKQEEVVLSLVSSLLETNMAIREEWAKRIVNQSRIMVPKEKKLIIT